MWTRVCAVRSGLVVACRKHEWFQMAAPTKAPLSSYSNNSEDNEDSTISYGEQRLAALKARHVKLYPHKFSVTTTAEQLRQNFHHLVAGQRTDEPLLSLAGIVRSVRTAGRHLRFIDLGCSEDKMQLIIRSDWLVSNNSCVSVGAQMQLIEQLRRGDRIGVTGCPVRSQAGELSLAVSSLSLLAPCLHQVPKTPLQSYQKRFRKRYLDLLTNPTSRRTVLARSAVIRSLRHYLEERDFLEVETPVLSHSVGGAAATPFITHLQEEDDELYLRIAPELYLKQLVVAGFDRVFEIGKVFRNEGVDPSHNPEFTSCEFYQAYADYRDLMHTTEELFARLYKVTEQYRVEADNSGSAAPHFDRLPYARLEFLPALESATGKAFPSPGQELDSADAHRFLLDLCRAQEIRVAPPFTLPRLLDKLAGHYIEPELVQPTFLLHHPLVMSPLAKPHRDNVHLSERFELFAGGVEICNAYTELNDPALQRAALANQAGLDDPEAMLPDEAYCTALEYGLPPTAGWGCGIDRLTALLTNRSNIRETILFPLMRQAHQPGSAE